MNRDPVRACFDLPVAQGRHLVALAGPPASGKSTLAATLAREISAGGRPATVLPMDGFHLGNAILDQRNLRARKGAPETFDLAGLSALLSRIQAGPRAEIAIPVFDRDRDLAESGAALIAPDVEIVVVEGNYLLLDRPGWRSLSSLWSLSIFLAVETRVLERRLAARWSNLPEQEAHRKIDLNDLPNARLVVEASRPADICLSS